MITRANEIFSNLQLKILKEPMANCRPYFGQVPVFTFPRGCEHGSVVSGLSPWHDETWTLLDKYSFSGSKEPTSEAR